MYTKLTSAIFISQSELKLPQVSIHLSVIHSNYPTLARAIHKYWWTTTTVRVNELYKCETKPICTARCSTVEWEKRKQINALQDYIVQVVVLFAFQSKVREGLSYILLRLQQSITWNQFNTRHRLDQVNILTLFALCVFLKKPSLFNPISSLSPLELMWALIVCPTVPLNKANWTYTDFFMERWIIMTWFRE